MISYKKTDVVIDLSLMKKQFKGVEEKERFLEWFLSALEYVEVFNRLRQYGFCRICNDMTTLHYRGEVRINSRYKMRIPNGKTDLVVDSSILHLVSVHNLVPDRSIIEALEKIKPRSSDS